MNRLTLFIFLSFCSAAYSQNKTVFTRDIDNFWTAFDSVRTTSDTVRQKQFIQSLYIDKGTEGLKAFMRARDYSAKRWVELINKYPKFWASIRPNTLSINSKAGEIEKSIRKFKKLYPELREARMYFTVGGLNSGGTTVNNLVLIGSEIATGNVNTDVSEFPNKWLAGVFKEQSSDNIIPLNIHEYVHTQQNGESSDLLSQAIKEGACDFITELVIGRDMQNNYIKYGYEHEKELKVKFKEEMFTTSFNNWLYNGSNADQMADLGYFMGYAICKSFYRKAADKKKAIRQIIELNYSDVTQVESFLKESGYYPEGFDKTTLQSEYTAKQPVVVRLEAFANGDTLVDASLKELKIVFSKSMNTKGYSIDMGERGREFFPLTGVTGFSDDQQAFTLKTSLKPDHEYEFVITGRSFKSADGYPLTDYAVKFKTKP